jgi:hypothetical protein
MTNDTIKSNLFDFFSTEVETISASQRTGLSKDAHTYLANMLVELGDPERLFPSDEPMTLADMHLMAGGAPPKEALRRYRELGDYALCVGGYFSDSLERKTVGVEYYADMGGAAYQRVAGLSVVTGHLSQLGELFEELSWAFRACLGLLSQLGDSGRPKQARDLGKLYERWLTTKDPHTFAQLTALGVFPTEPQEGC